MRSKLYLVHTAESDYFGEEDGSLAARLDRRKAVACGAAANLVLATDRLRFRRTEKRRSPLSQVLVPVDHSPPPSQALRTIEAFTGLMNAQGATIELMHVGETAPRVHRAADEALVPVTKRTGDVVSTILEAAEEQQADLIAMPTAGHHGFLDAMRGSIRERVMRQAPCPVLSVPVG